MTSKDKLLKKIFGALEGVDIKQSTSVSKINKAKKLGEVPFPSKNVRENKINYGKGLDYIYGTKPIVKCQPP